MAKKASKQEAASPEQEQIPVELPTGPSLPAAPTETTASNSDAGATAVAADSISGPKAPDQPGIYPGLDNDLYHGGPGVSNSGLGLLIECSPYHYWDRYLSGVPYPETESNEALLLGSALHCATLEPDFFEDRYTVVPDDAPNKRSKDGKAWWEDFTAKIAGKQLLTADQLTTVRGMASSVRKHPAFRKITAKGVAEQAMYWLDPETGLLCKVKPDWYREGLIMDVKSTISAAPEDFKRSIHNFAYYRQAPFYLNGTAIATNTERHSNFVFFAVEKRRPFACAPYVIEDEAIHKGEAEIRKGLNTLARCFTDKVWPSYNETITPINLPPYAYRT